MSSRVWTFAMILVGSCTIFGLVFGFFYWLKTKPNVEEPCKDNVEVKTHDASRYWCEERQRLMILPHWGNLKEGTDGYDRYMIICKCAPYDIPILDPKTGMPIKEAPGASIQDANTSD